MILESFKRKYIGKVIFHYSYLLNKTTLGEIVDIYYKSYKKFNKYLSNKYQSSITFKIITIDNRYFDMGFPCTSANKYIERHLLKIPNQYMVDRINNKIKKLIEKT